MSESPPEKTVLFMDILGFKNAIITGVDAVLPIYKLISGSVAASKDLSIEHFFAVSDSIFAVTEQTEDAVKLALQIMTVFFDNLDLMPVPALLRGGIARGWMTSLYAPRRELDTDTSSSIGLLNIVGMGLVKAYYFSESAPGMANGAAIRIERHALSNSYLDEDSLSKPRQSDYGEFYEFKWPREVFKEWPDATARFLNNIVGAIPKVGNNTKHYFSTLELILESGIDIDGEVSQACHSFLESAYREEDNSLPRELQIAGRVYTLK